MNGDTTETKTSDRARTWLPRFWVSVSLILGAAISACHFIQPDSLAPVTMIPAWLWLVPGVFFAFLGRRAGWKPLIVACAVWIFFSVLFAEEIRSLIRRIEQPRVLNAESKSSESHAKMIRVATLNCYMAKSAEALVAYQPDIVLLQESPGEARLAELSAKLFGADGGYVWGGDTSVVARGEMIQLVGNKQPKFTHAKFETEDGNVCDIISLRLSPPVFRMDFWSGGFWSDHRAMRQKHRQELGDIATYINSHFAPDSIHVVGGDFNLPANDGALAALRGLPHSNESNPLVDTFYESGAGWCNTATNDWPLFRVDQVWSNRRPKVSRAYKSTHSDHRFVIVDLLIE